jgi:hypothetical protein
MYVSVDRQLVTQDMQQVFNAFYSYPRGYRIVRFHHKYKTFLQGSKLVLGKQGFGNCVTGN